MQWNGNDVSWMVLMVHVWKNSMVLLVNWIILIDKNRRLGKAVEGLENEVISLREKVAASSSSNDGGDGGYDVSLREGSDTRMEVAELSKEN